METLSYKIYKHAIGSVRHPDSIPIEAVKEFIRECRKQIIKKGRRFNINKLAGDKLIWK